MFVRNITCSVVFSPVLCSVHLLCFALLFSVPLPPHLFCSQCFSMLLICSVFFSADLFSVFIFSVFICSHWFSVLICSPQLLSVLVICSLFCSAVLHPPLQFCSSVLLIGSLSCTSILGSPHLCQSLLGHPNDLREINLYNFCCENGKKQ